MPHRIFYGLKNPLVAQRDHYIFKRFKIVKEIALLRNGHTKARKRFPGLRQDFVQFVISTGCYGNFPENHVPAPLESSLHDHSANTESGLPDNGGAPILPVIQSIWSRMP